jgi:hypothetical protein
VTPIDNNFEMNTDLSDSILESCCDYGCIADKNGGAPEGGPIKTCRGENKEPTNPAIDLVTLANVEVSSGGMSMYSALSVSFRVF